MHHLPGWQPISPDVFMAEVDVLTSAEGWVIDGNYGVVVDHGPVWRRADTVVWIDLPRRVVMAQVVARSLRRIVRREELWNGNRERLSNLLSWDPGTSIIRWSWTQHCRTRQRYRAAMESAAYRHLRFHRLRSRAEIEAWLDGVAGAAADSSV